MKYIIKAPNETHNGMTGGVQFKNGVGETDVDYLAEWFARKGYTVEPEELKEKPIGKMNKDELLTVAAERGIEVSAELTKAQIIELLGGE